jgi:adenylate cyclase
VAIEIERKFLVSNGAWRVAALRSSRLRQGYLANNERCSVRVRVAGESAWLSVKAMRPGRARAEFEYPVPVADADALLDGLCERPFVEKWRHVVPYAGHEWEVDEFLGDNAGLVIAELELDREDAPFERPPWLGREVTEDVRFYNFSLARRPWREFRDDSGEPA